MDDRYEVQIHVEDDDSSFYVDHRFPSLPDVGSLRLLKAEAELTFEALFGCAPESCRVSACYLAKDERAPVEVVGAESS